MYKLLPILLFALLIAEENEQRFSEKAWSKMYDHLQSTGSLHSYDIKSRIYVRQKEKELYIQNILNLIH